MNPVFWNGVWLGMLIGVCASICTYGITPLVIRYIRDKKKISELPKDVGRKI